MKKYLSKQVEDSNEDSQERSILDRSYEPSALLDDVPPMPKDAKGVCEVLFGIHRYEMRARSRAHLTGPGPSIGELRYHLNSVTSLAERALEDAQCRQTRREDYNYDPPSLTLPESYKPKLSPPYAYRSVSQDCQGFRDASFYPNHSLPDIGHTDAPWTTNAQPDYHVPGDNYLAVLDNSNVIKDLNAPEYFSSVNANYGPNTTLFESDDEAGLQVKLECLDVIQEANQSNEICYIDEDFVDSEVVSGDKNQHQMIELLSSESEARNSFIQNFESERNFKCEVISSEDHSLAHSDDISESQNLSSQRSQKLHPTVTSSECNFDYSQENLAVHGILCMSSNDSLPSQENLLLEESALKTSLEATKTETSCENTTSYICQNLPSHSPNKGSKFAATMLDSSCPVSCTADQLVIEHDQASQNKSYFTDNPEIIPSQETSLDLGFENFNPDNQLVIPTIDSSHIILNNNSFTSQNSSGLSQFLDSANQAYLEATNFDNQLSNPNLEASHSILTEDALPCQIQPSCSNLQELEDQYASETSNLSNQCLCPAMDVLPNIKTEETVYNQGYLILSGSPAHEVKYAVEASAHGNQSLRTSLDPLNFRSGQPERNSIHTFSSGVMRHKEDDDFQAAFDNHCFSQTLDGSLNVKAEETKYTPSQLFLPGLNAHEIKYAYGATAHGDIPFHTRMTHLSYSSKRVKYVPGHTFPSEKISHKHQHSLVSSVPYNRYCNPTVPLPDVEAEQTSYVPSAPGLSDLPAHEIEYSNGTLAHGKQSFLKNLDSYKTMPEKAETKLTHYIPSDAICQEEKNISESSSSVVTNNSVVSIRQSISKEASPEPNKLETISRKRAQESMKSSEHKKRRLP